MKHLQLKNTEYQKLESGFKEWLQTLNYAESTVMNSPNYVREFLFYLENNNCHFIKNITTTLIKDYFVYLSRRSNHRKPGALSINSLKGRLGAVRRFSKYLRETGQGNFEVPVQLPATINHPKTILTKNEIKALYNEADDTILGSRDKAMLTIYYGCGLRRSEGEALNLKDVMLDKEKIHVRKGKNYKERQVPITPAIKTDLENYLKNARPHLTINSPGQQAFFVNVKGGRMRGHSLYERLKQLSRKAGILKPVGLHILRHSIATHLLQSGMKLDDISKFLGHSSLESTQIYTHLSAETE